MSREQEMSESREGASSSSDEGTHDMPEAEIGEPGPEESAGPTEAEGYRFSKHSPGGFRELLELAYPVVLSMMAFSLLNIADTWFMGKVSTTAQGAVGLGGVLIWTFVSFFSGTINGVGTFVSQKEGEGEYKEAGRFLWQGVWLALLAWPLLVMLGGTLPWIMRMGGSNPELADIAQSYGQIRLYGSGMILISASITAFLRGIGDTRTPMYVTFALVGINIPFNYLFVFGVPGWIEPMGANGAAWGTVAARIVELGIYAWVLLRPMLREKYETHRWAFELSYMRRLIKIGVPMGVQWVLEMGSWTVFIIYVSRWGKLTAAANQIVIQILHTSFMPGYAISLAATTLVGQYIGAKSLTHAERSGRNAIISAVVFMGTMGVVFFLFGGFLTSLFNEDPQVIALGTQLFVFAAIFQIFDGVTIASSGALRGAGDTQYPMWISLLASWFLFVPLVHVLGESMDFKIHGAWIGAMLYMIMTSIMLARRWQQGRWRAIQI